VDHKEYKNILLNIKHNFLPGYIFLLASNKKEQKAKFFFEFLAEMQSIFSKTLDPTLQQIRITWWKEAIENNLHDNPLIKNITNFNAIALLDIFEAKIENKPVSYNSAKDLLLEFCKVLNITESNISTNSIDIMADFFNSTHFSKNIVDDILNKSLRKFCRIAADIVHNPKANRFRPWFMVKLILK